MTHSLMIVLFALLVATAFGVIGRDTTRARALYSLSVFTKFVVVAFLLAWILYFLPN